MAHTKIMITESIQSELNFTRKKSIVRVVGIIPGLSFLVYSVAGIWMLVAMVVAVRQALDYHSLWHAVGVGMIGWIIQILTITLFFSMFAGRMTSS